MKQKIVYSIIVFLFFYFNIFAENMVQDDEMYFVKNEITLKEADVYRTISPMLDVAVIKEEIKFGNYKYAKLINAEMVKINGNVYVAMKYDVDVQYVYKNAKIMRSVHYDIYHPVLVNKDNYVLALADKYLQHLLIYSEEQINRKFDTYEVIKKLDINNFKGHFLLDNIASINNIKSNVEDVKNIEETLEVLPYIQLDENGYAYFYKTNIRVNSQSNIILSYYPDDDITVIELVDFENGRFISHGMSTRKGNIKIEQISEDKEIVIKNANQEVAKIKYKDKRLEGYEILINE